MKGQITIFISMIMTCVFALLCGLVESARTAGARWYLQTAASSALDSVFSQYHRELWDSYRLLFAEYEDYEELEADFSSFLTPYFEVENWFPAALDQVEVEDWKTAVDESGIYLEQEILDYMKYGVWNLDFETDTVEQLWDTAKEAAAAQKISERYRGHAGEALKLEKALEAISENQQKQNELKAECLSELEGYDCDGFTRTARKLIKEFQKVPSLVREYEKQADALAKKLEESRKVYETEKTDCDEELQNRFSLEISQYEAYVNENGARRKEIEELVPCSEGQIAFVEGVIEEAEAVQEEIDNWEDDDEEDDGPDLDALWSPVIHHFSRLEIRSLSFRHGVADKKTEGWLNRVVGMYRAGILKLVVPEGKKVSSGVIQLEDFPSAEEGEAGGHHSVSLWNHILIDEYCGDFFRCFCTEDAGQSEQQKTYGIPGTDGLQYELEYLICGKASDEENLTGVVNRLFVIREGLNLAWLMSNEQKRTEAQTLAMTITGITGLAPLVLLTTFFVLSVWAIGETLMDIRGLLSEKRVPLWKSEETWTLSLEKLLLMGQNAAVEEGGGNQGLTYLSWLKILLFMDDIAVQELRMMDMMQMNIRRKQKSFRFRRCVYQVKLKSSLRAKHVFFSPGFVQNFAGNREFTYPVTILTERVY